MLDSVAMQEQHMMCIQCRRLMTDNCELVLKDWSASGYTDLSSSLCGVPTLTMAKATIT